MKNRLVQSTETQVIDRETGEITSTKTTNVVYLPKEPPFVKLYLEDVSRLLDLQAGASQVLYQLALKIDYEGFVTITKSGRERIAKKLNMKETSVRNRISDLTKKNLLKRTGRCEYEMNPRLFAKGDWSDIYKRRCKFKLEIVYDEYGKKTLKGNII